MHNIKVLDVTLRDGGCVNNFNFGQMYMEKILKAQEASGVDIIELGYIDEKNGSVSDRTQYVNEKVIKDCILKHKSKTTSYVVMIDYGKFDIDKLSMRTEDGIDGIRLAFHKKDAMNILSVGRKIMDKGYDLYIQPMITLRYTDAELIELIDNVNKELPDATAFYIVDSFGEMRPNDMDRVLNLVDHNLIPAMTIGYHSHNNLQMSYSNAISMLRYSTKRQMIIDSSIMGMGKGAGNLNTELLLEHLNIYYDKNYKVEPLLEVMDKVINQLHSEFYWGYSPEYYLSSANHCTPSYASHFYNKHKLPIDQVGELLNMIPDDKKISFDKDYAELLYRQYNEQKFVDDTQTVEDLKGIIAGKKIVLIAPGKSLSTAGNQIESYLTGDDVLCIGLNVVGKYNVDYTLITRQDLYEDAIANGEKIITTSAVTKGGRGNVWVLDYKRWIDISEITHDSSVDITFNLLSECGVKHILLAGFDGFSVDINENYYDASMRYPVNSEQMVKYNNYNKSLIKKMRDKGVYVEFITPSKYE